MKTKNKKIQKTSLRPLFVAAIIDRSGSIQDYRLTDPIISGFNEYLQDIQTKNPDALMSLTLFNTERELRYIATPIKNVDSLNRLNYVPNGGTALYDAIGLTIAEIEKKNYEKTYRVLVVVMTDGEENSSTDFKEHHIMTIKNRIEEKGWKYVYFGLGHQAQVQGRRMGVQAKFLGKYDASPIGTASAYRNLSHATTLYSAGASEEIWAQALHQNGKSIDGSILHTTPATGIGDAGLLEQISE